MPRFGRVFAAACSLIGAAFLAVSPTPAHAGTSSAVTFPISVDPATRGFVDADGKHVLIMGDASWSLIVQLTARQVQQYLDDRRARGFNAVLVNLIEHKFAANPPKNAYGQAPFTTAGDFSTPNNAYFAYAEWVVQQAQLRGMLVLLAPMYLGYAGGDQGWYQELLANGTTKAKSYGAYIGQRFAKYPNIIWVHGGDMAPQEALAQIDALASGIKQYDTVHLHTAHSVRENSSLDDYNRPWLTADAIYTDCDVAQSKSRSEWLRGGTMPMFHIEGIYENEGASSDCLLGQMYYPILLGGRGHVFGNRPMWLFDTGWQGALGSPGAQWMQYAVGLYASRDAATLVPDMSGAIVSSGAGTPDTADYAAAGTTSTSVLVYVPSARTVTIDTTKLAFGSFVAWWYDPRTGVPTRIGDFSSGGPVSFPTPASVPAVLVLDAATAALQPPGVDVSDLHRGDLVWHNQVNGALAVWYMNGPSAQGFSSLSPGSIGLSWRLRGLADFNGDGRLDLVWQNATTGDLAVWFMKGNTATGYAYLSPSRVSPVWQIRGLGDLDGDGKPDILWENVATGDLAAWLMNGTSAARFTSITPNRLDPSWRARGLADCDGDGTADIIWQNDTTGSLAVWYMNGTTASAWSSAYLTPKTPANISWKVRRVFDMNGDGKPDLVWQNETTGDLSVWYMNGAVSSGSAGLNPSRTGTSWQLAAP